MCVSGLHGNGAGPSERNADMGSNDSFAAVSAASCGGWRGFDGCGVCAGKLPLSGYCQ